MANGITEKLIDGNRVFSDFESKVSAAIIGESLSVSVYDGTLNPARLVIDKERGWDLVRVIRAALQGCDRLPF